MAPAAPVPSAASQSGKGGRIAAGKVPSGTVTNTAPTAAEIIVPGQFSELDWVMMIERDYADELGVALVDELLAAVDEIIYNQYMERQLVPYTIHSILSQALDAVDPWRESSHYHSEFLPVKDEYVEHFNTAEFSMTTLRCMFELEPEPGTMECWSTGVVPTFMKTRRSTIDVDELLQHDSSQLLPSLLEQIPSVVTDGDEDEDHDDLAAAAAADDDKDGVAQVDEPASYPSPDMPSRDQLPVSDVISVARDVADAQPVVKPCAAPTPSVDSLDDETRLQYRLPKPAPAVCLTAVRPKAAATEPAARGLAATQTASDKPFSSLDHQQQPTADARTTCKRLRGDWKNVQFNSEGNIVAMQKINPARLPKDIVNVGFQVLKPPKPQRRLRHPTSTTVDAEVRPRECDNPKPMFRPSAANRPIQKPAPQQTRQLTHDPMVNAIRLEAGVVFSEGNRVKKGPQPLKGRGLSQTDLKPVKMEKSDPPSSFTDILEKPVLRLPEHVHPLPPISAAQCPRSQLF